MNRPANRPALAFPFAGVGKVVALIVLVIALGYILFADQASRDVILGLIAALAAAILLL